ncbi:MarR family winged helix-turn-helix transcriptional regulator [Sporomusa sp.]|uniref:MarR family winged helix-turn-helix transcriptional regulator n=1 Tax=Sporomusa sp. TaxID=2078658 RepID=UPI002CE20E5B|nr:MarR family winged helix-turn-helix transcriptional regulator [Sporomusa sp.]HWR07087.1 MarR family winged helix-turn-helix transcriptional regulator [Sporomusa sp.]
MNYKIYPQHPGVCNYCMNIRRASRAVTQFYDDVLKPSGLTVAQLSLLRHLEMAKIATISNLAKMMRIDRTTLNRNMKPLIEAGFIAVNPGKDSRTREIKLTTAGKNAADKGWALWGESQAALKEYMGEVDLARLVQLLSKLEAIVP